ncbi:MAG: hypothetical protein E5299_02536 [Burkholderia gladioli]|nr:MAG: hypothetical protein E5299_02536 [Burkholderia gladioli]
MAKRCGFDDPCSQSSTSTFAKTHSKIEKWLFAHLLQKQPVARFSRYMAEQAMVDSRWVCCIKYCCCGTCDKTIDDNRNFLHACSEDCACHSSDFSAAQTAQHFQRVFEVILMKIDRGTNSSKLALQKLTN